jgi:putative hydrolase
MAVMSSGSNPFEGMPFFGDLLKMLGSQGPVQWDGARQLALSIATGGESEANVDPLERVRYEQLARVADLHVAQATGLIGSIEAADPADGSDPTEAWITQIMGLLSPMLLGMTTGSLVGHLATRNFGSFDLPIPRPPSDDVLIIASNVEAFASDWSMDGDDLRLWVCVHQVTHHAVLGVPHVRERLDELLGDYASSFESDPDALNSKLGELEVDPTGGDPMARFQELMGDPDVVLGAVRSSRQQELLPWLDALVTVIAGYVDHVMDRIGHGLVGTYPQITEALRRRRVEASAQDRFVERLLGLELTPMHFDRGTAFISGIVDRAGPAALEQLWASAEALPTPNEVDAPGLWVARMDLPVIGGMDLDELEVPDDLGDLDGFGDQP